MSVKIRTNFTFRIDTWTADGESIVEHVAGVEDYQVALATYRAACLRWPGTPHHLAAGCASAIAAAMDGERDLGRLRDGALLALAQSNL
jgi:hypothetical protein